MKSSFNTKKKAGIAIAGLGLTLGLGVALQTEPASATVPEEVQEAIDTSIATVNALSPLALAALAIALIPFGSMLALKFLNMVMARI